MRGFSYCLAVAIALFGLHLEVPAQTQEGPLPQKKSGVGEDKIVSGQELSIRIVSVLSATADDARRWEDNGVAARTQARIADLIWDLDYENARNHLKAAWTAAAKVEEPKRPHSTFVNPSLRNAVRRDVLLVARKRSPELAAVWLEEVVHETKGDEKEVRGTFDDRSARSSVLLQMANQVLADDPQAAAELVIQSLRDGISFNLQTTLVRIQQIDSVLAETVFRVALNRLRTAGLSDPNEILTLYAYLYTPGRVHGANTSDNRNQVQLAVGGPRVSVPAGRQNPALALEFLELASDLLLSVPLPDNGNTPASARSLVSVIGLLLREVTPRLPDKAALLRARAQQLDAEARFLNSPSRPTDMPQVRPGESNESFIERRVDLLEELAAKGRDVLTRDIGYATAAVATTAERYESGLTLTGKIEDKNLRDGARSWLIYRAVLHLIAAGNLVEAHKLNLKNDELPQRAACLVVGAQRLIRDNDTIRANEWLREAGALAKRSEPDESSARVLFGIVSTYGKFDSQLAYSWLQEAVKQIRKIPTASLNDDKAPRLKRLNGITPVADFTNTTSGFSLQSAVAAFSNEEFEQVLYMLTEIAPKEARGLAIVTLCHEFLNANLKDTKKPPRQLLSK